MSDKLSAPPETTGKDFVPVQTGNKKIAEKNKQTIFSLTTKDFHV